MQKNQKIIPASPQLPFCFLGPRREDGSGGLDRARAFQSPPCPARDPGRDLGTVCHLSGGQCWWTLVFLGRWGTERGAWLSQTRLVLPESTNEPPGHTREMGPVLLTQNNGHLFGHLHTGVQNSVSLFSPLMISG